MGKVTFEFDEGKDSYDLKMINNRNDIMTVLEELNEYRRELYDGYPDNEILVKDKKVIAEGKEILKITGEAGICKSYIPVHDVEKNLDNILSKIKYLWRD